MSAKSEVKRKTKVLKRIQNNRCILCYHDLDSVKDEYGRSIALDKKASVLDHDHESGFVRGVLCRWCNSLEGMYANEMDLQKKFEYALRATSGLDISAQEWIDNLENYLAQNTHAVIYDRDNSYMEISQKQQREINQLKKSKNMKWRKSFEN